MADASSESEEEYSSMEYSSGEYSTSEEDVDFKSHTFKTEQQREERRLFLKKILMRKLRERRKEDKQKQSLFWETNKIATPSENSSENSDISLNSALNEEVPENNLVDDGPLDIIVSDEDDIYSDIDNIEMLEETKTSLPFVEQLKQYANKTALNCVQVNGLLKLIHNNKKTIGIEEVINISGVPKTYKTLFKISNKKVKDKIIAIQPDHKLYYFGLAKQILFYLKQYPIHSLDALQPSNTLELIWNTDGMKLYQSRDESAWPILCYIKNLFPRKVFEVLLTTGTGKPNLEFIKLFVDELKELMQNGLVFKDSTSKERTFKVHMVAAVCDAPARADIKCIKHHNSYAGCDFCMIEGTYIGNYKNGVKQPGGTMTFQGSEDWIMRTDENFRNQEQKEHHSKKETPLLELDIDMIRHFPIDFMHGSGGTMKKLFDCWIKHPLTSSSYRITGTNIAFLNERIKYISRECLPNIFPRKLRSTSEHQHYKFSEHKQFLLYTGKILLLELMQDEKYYYNFLKYSTACSIMNDGTTSEKFQTLSKNLIRDVIDSFQQHYGDKFMTYSSHTNIHYPEIAAYHGGLATVSAYPFENHLRHLRKWVSRSSHQAMVTMVNGILRRQSVECTEVLQARESAIYFSSPNNVYIDTSSWPVSKCYEALKRTMDGRIVLNWYHNPMNLYTDPIPSKLVGCFKINPEQHREIILTNDEVEKFRRGFKICLNGLAGIPESLKPYWVIHMVSHDEDEHIFS